MNYSNIIYNDIRLIPFNTLPFSIPFHSIQYTTVLDSIPFYIFGGIYILINGGI